MPLIRTFLVRGLYFGKPSAQPRAKTDRKTHRLDRFAQFYAVLILAIVVMQVGKFGAVLGAILILISAFRIFGPQRWPFKVLKPRGVHQTTKLKEGDMDERKRDFGRTATASGLYVVTPSASTPTTWSSPVDATGSMDREMIEAISSEFREWLEGVVKNTKKGTIEEGLLQRCLSYVAVSNGIDFATQNQFPVMMKQLAFVLVVSATGEVRVVLLAFITDETTLKTNPSMEAGPYIVRMLTADLNSANVEATAANEGVSCQYVATENKENIMSKYIDGLAAAFSRAAVENHWEDLLA